MTALNAQDMKMEIRPNHDDAARREIIVALKRVINLDMAAGMRALVDQKIAPKLEADLGRPLDKNNAADREVLKTKLTEQGLFKLWSAMTYDSQTLMWECVEDILAHELPRLQNAAETHSSSAAKVGSLELDPALDIPANIAETEIHRQPGGFAFDRGQGDITAGAYQLGGGWIYAKGKGHDNLGGYSGAGFLIDYMRGKFPDFTPTKMLDIGCGWGGNTTPYWKHFPGIEIHAIECAPGLLRFAHARAESLCVPVHFKQMSAEALTYDDESFDLVVSHIVGHETTHEILPKMVAESWRVVKPGGVILHLDVAFQKGFIGLTDQVLNDWQVKYNGEPFWMGWADSDMEKIMIEQGYPEGAGFTEHVKREAGPGAWFVHGAFKPG